MSAYYNEFDPGAAAWLRELMKRGLIADGEVDDRSILEVQPDDLRGYTQCHFFAGVGVWSYALRNAGWPDARPVWTASLPCQPFSAAGKQEGHADERHLAPVWLRLVRECRPAIAIGEQVSAAVGMGWLDALFISLEQSGYACGAAVFPACSVGAPHIRSRLYWVAHAERDGGWADEQGRRSEGRAADGRDSAVGQLGYPASGGRGIGGDAPQPGSGRHADGAGVMGDAEQPGSQGCERPGDVELHRGPGAHGSTATAGFWRDAEWLPCRDGKARPTGRGIHPLVVGNAKQRGSEELRRDGDEQSQDAAGGRDGSRQGPTECSPLPLAHGPAAGVGLGGDCGSSVDPNQTSEARVMRLKGYGNAIVAPAAVAWIETVMEVVDE